MENDETPSNDLWKMMKHHQMTYGNDETPSNDQWKIMNHHQMTYRK